MKKQLDIVELLRHSRHDWLNKLQLIKGNIELNNLDRVKEIIEEMVFEAEYEAKLSNLKLPSLAAYLMTYNWESHKVFIEYEVLGEVQDLSKYDRSMINWTKSLIELLENSVHPNGNHHLNISIDIRNNDVRFFFDFRGIISETDKITLWVKNNNSEEQISITDYDLHTTEMSLEVSLL
ncbi:Spo0B C-terminal domain-containing protein [Bacillus sp. SM2101]|uniref:Spo0B C-terminal domain-containing protein n=1 Tax=Bacillus sp. SM2101 TaxID=2805366 RepID=UPI001BDE0017|nr:Spo0B C-terminal domain-containing protein [Bacillus sp. SM2101]